MVSQFGSLGYTIMGKTADLTVVQKTLEFGYSCRIPLVKPLLNHRQRQRRLTWAKEKKNWTVAQWSKVELGGIPVHTEYRCLFFLRYDFLKYRNTGVI